MDGGFGDAIYREDLLAICETEAIAREYVAKHECPHVYAEPYAKLECGHLRVRKLTDLVITAENMETPPWTEWEMELFKKTPWQDGDDDEDEDWDDEDEETETIDMCRVATIELAKACEQLGMKLIDHK